MKTKKEIIAELKAEYPTLRTGSDETNYTNLPQTEYAEVIEQWAINTIAAQELEAEAEAAATQKAALLARLGITADEAKLLIG